MIIVCLIGYALTIIEIQIMNATYSINKINQYKNMTFYYLIQLLVVKFANLYFQIILQPFQDIPEGNHY